jgi:hypothetical protein
LYLLSSSALGFGSQLWLDEETAARGVDLGFLAAVSAAVMFVSTKSMIELHMNIIRTIVIITGIEKLALLQTLRCIVKLAKALFLCFFVCYQISHKLDLISQFPFVGIWNIVNYESSLHFSIIGPLI